MTGKNAIDLKTIWGGESAFITMLPQESRIKARNDWHRNAPKEANEFLANPEFEKNAVINIPY